MPELSIDSTYGVIVIQDLKAVSVDEKYANLYGYDSSQELLDSVDSFLELIPTQYHAKAIENYNEIIAGRMVPHGHTFTNVDRYGREFTVFSVDHLISWENKPALQVTVIDLSVVVEANRRIRQHDQMFKKMIMQSGQGIMVHRDFTPLMINDAWVRLMRAKSKEQVMEMTSILSIIPKRNQETVKQHYRDIISRKIVGRSVTTENICFDGSRRFFNIYDNVIEWDGEPAVQVILEDVTDKVLLEKTLAYRASYDQLTDLFNRSAIYDWLKSQLEYNDTIACILLDVDDFKKINDTYGHFTGDEVLRVLAAMVKRIVHQYDGVVGRWGGEEFIGLIPYISLEEAGEVAEEIRIAFHNYFFNLNDLEFNSSVSLGVSFGDKCIDLKSVENLIREADQRLYIAKGNGKNQVCVD
ncbi:sensor domain-containing diguanylate cyclase [Vibrio tapetis subsp. quintayensis]|uniref:sensor domain-containing diguanylate cyclase n=1 Tax=Vibrio tapetis TaxID=52443 RepID=UPI0025B58E98|nr:sensor domain-containing diguanylate cyclase [Vibrio tapetis]MDN3683045.1 sensor domain-containing diguanylate cyclase [Vibrio tapetis subsp. quintayensis]